MQTRESGGRPPSGILHAQLIVAKGEAELSVASGSWSKALYPISVIHASSLVQAGKEISV